jgi:hypothetical protein
VALHERHTACRQDRLDRLLDSLLRVEADDRIGDVRIATTTTPQRSWRAGLRALRARARY